MRNAYLPYAVIIVVSCVLFVPFLGQVHLFDWDEINFAECAREMIVSKDYLRPQIDFMPFWEKPPFFMWMQVVSMKLFGINELAARFPNAFAGIITLVALFYAGKRVVNEKMATWWVLLYAASWLPHFYFKTGIIDPTFNLFIFLAFFQVYLLRVERKTIHAVLAGLFLGMAVLTKGPVAILIAGLAFAVYVAVRRSLTDYKIKHLLMIAVLALVPVLAWLGITAAVHGAAYGKWFLNEFITYQVRLFTTEDADHGGPFFYHFIVLLVGCFPASAFLFSYLTDKPKEKSDFTRWMWILFWAVLILFSIVKTKIVHYSSLCYFPLTWLAALAIYRADIGEMKIRKWIMVLTVGLGSLVAIVITLLPVVGMNKQRLIPLIDDPFAVGNLGADVSWSYAECLWGILYLVGVIAAGVLLNKSFRKGMLVLCVVQIVIIQVTVLHFTPKIEAYSQRAAIDYFKSLQGKDVYIHSLGYKSYATFFYGQTGPATDENYKGIRRDKDGKAVQPEANEQWLLHGAIDKPAYFISKIQDKAKFAALPELTLLGEKNGFVFFMRNK
jgi:4-amino-4-deoxy-L-arabinose transferase-like glycosyltransferase